MCIMMVTPQFVRVIAFENAIFHQLRAQSLILNYYRKKTGLEIDFIATRDKKIKAYEVKLQANKHDQTTLTRLAKELRIEDANLISYRFAPGAKTWYGFQI